MILLGFEIAHLAALLSSFEEVERGLHDGTLRGCITSRAKRLPARETCDQRPRRLNALRGSPQIGKRDRWNARRFDCPRNQSDRLVAEWSHRHKQGCISAGCDDLFGNGTGSVSGKGFGVGDVAHEAIPNRCHIADDSVGGKLVKPVHGVHSVVISERVSRIVVAVRNRDLGLLEARWQCPVGLISLGI